MACQRSEYCGVGNNYDGRARRVSSFLTGFARWGSDVIVENNSSPVFRRRQKRQFGLRSNAAQNNVRRARAAGSPLLSALLLVLFAHAFMASATHFHRPETAGAKSATAATSASTPSFGVRGDAEDARDANFHAQCLLCRLQRNFVADLHHRDARTTATPQRHEDDQAHVILSFSQGAFLIPAGRAPPLA